MAGTHDRHTVGCLIRGPLQCVQTICPVTPLQSLGLGLLCLTGRSASVIEGACPQSGLSAQRQGVDPVPMPLQALLKMPVLQPSSPALPSTSNDERYQKAVLPAVG